MKCYIKAKDTFLNIAQRDTDDYNLTLDSMSGEKGSVTILSTDSPSFLNGSWLLLNGEIWRINTATPKNGKTQLSLLPVDTLFDRELAYEESNAATVGAFIAGIISSEWINQTDAVYDTPYITVASTDTTAFVAPTTDDDGTFNFLDYIREMRQTKNVVIHASYSGNTLALTISKDAVVTHPLVINDGHTQLISSSFKASALAKVTVFKKEDTGNTDQNGDPIYQTVVSDWYLAADGTVTDTEPLVRAEGEWGSTHISGDDVAADAAAEEFATNETSRKIELYSDVSMAVGDKAKIRINGEIIEATVTGIYRKKGDSRTRYKLGDMITTLTEKVEAMGTATAIVVRSSGGGGGGGGSYVLTPQDKQDIADIVLSELPTWNGGNY